MTDTDSPSPRPRSSHHFSESLPASARRLLLVVGCTIAIASCGSNNSNIPITVAFTTGFLPPSQMATDTTTGIAATVSNDQQNLGVRWTVSCGSSACGSFSPTTSPSTVPTTYSAPATIPKGTSVTVTATSVSDPTKFASAIITVN